MNQRAVAAAVGAAAIAGYAARWWWNYSHRPPEPEPVPEDIAGWVELTCEDQEILDELEDRTCMEQCCVDYDEISAYYETE